MLGDLGVIKCLTNILAARKPIHAAGLRLRKSSGWHGQGSHSSIRKTHKSTVMRELAVTKESSQHRESLKCERLIDERILPLKGLNGTARWTVVRVVEKRRDDLREQFCNRGKPAGCLDRRNGCAADRARPSGTRSHIRRVLSLPKCTDRHISFEKV